MTGSTATQRDIEDLLNRLQILGERIKAARAALAPLEKELAAAKREFDERVGPLHREKLRLEYQIRTLEARPETMPADGIMAIGSDPVIEPAPEIAVARIRDPEAVDKDILLEHLMRVLDPELDPQASELLATVQGLANNPVTRLADLLEEMPWGSAWTGQAPAENLASQHRRLLTWERALSRQLEALQQSQERLREADPRYRLYAERQLGPELWNAYLDRAAERQREQNLELSAVVEELHRARADSGDNR
jgi:hypothetical protein